MIGKNWKIGIGKESSRGVSVAPSVWMPLTEAPYFVDQRDGISDEAGYGVIAERTDRVITKKWGEGEIKGNVQDETIGYLLLAALGQVSSALKGGESAVYDHTFSLLNSNQHPSFTLEVKNDNQQLAHALCMLKSLKISGEAGKYVEFAASFIGKKGATASNSVVFADEREFFSKMLTFKIASNLAGLDAASAVNIRSFEISIEKNPEALYVLGSDEPSDIQNQQIAIEGNIEAYFDDTTIKAIYEGGDSKAIRIDATHTETIGTASNPRIKTDFPKVQFEDWKPAGGLNEQVTQTVKFGAMYSLADSMLARIILTNEKASY